MAILAYLTLKAFIYKGIKSAKVVGGLEMHFGGLELKFKKVVVISQANKYFYKIGQMSQNVDV